MGPECSLPSVKRPERDFYHSPAPMAIYKIIIARWWLLYVAETCSCLHNRFNESCALTVCVALYRVSQEEWTKLLESVPYVELYRYNPKQLYPKLNGYGDNGHRKMWASGVSTYCTPSVTPYSSTAHAQQRHTAS